MTRTARARIRFTPPGATRPLTCHYALIECDAVTLEAFCPGMGGYVRDQNGRQYFGPFGRTGPAMCWDPHEGTWEQFIRGQWKQYRAFAKDLGLID